MNESSLNGLAYFLCMERSKLRPILFACEQGHTLYLRWLSKRIGCEPTWEDIQGASEKFQSKYADDLAAWQDAVSDFKEDLFKIVAPLANWLADKLNKFNHQPNLEAPSGDQS